ncbi:nucleolar protein 16 [Anastrepha obliqua]|uniref:nucleolar protein 16 n=1 Tax=Anastrepha obliqua TaxID=95512 RepID=UPI00240A3DE1|nr:nucleolar protein 16 [Anastrepha obliqua]
MKIRKNHHRKRYRYSVNRKTMSKTRQSTGKIKDPEMKKLWIETKRNKNFYEMGLASDPNKVVPIPNFKESRLKTVKVVNGFVEEEMDDEELKEKVTDRPRGYVIEQLEASATAPREKLLRLPKNSVDHLSYFLDKYKFNYKAMVTDRRNYLQWTWKQFRMKIRKFMSIPEQFDEYLKQRNLKPGEKPAWEEYESDSEWK